MRVERRRGDTRADVCTVLLADTGEPANITGCTFKMVVSSKPFPADQVTVVYEVQGSIVDAPNGVVEFHPTTIQVDRSGYFYYEVKMVDSYGAIHTPLFDSYVFK